LGNNALPLSAISTSRSDFVSYRVREHVFCALSHGSIELPSELDGWGMAYAFKKALVTNR